MRMARTCLVNSSWPLAIFSAWSAGGGAAGAGGVRRGRAIADSGRALKRVARGVIRVGSPAGGGKASLIVRERGAGFKREAGDGRKCERRCASQGLSAVGARRRAFWILASKTLG